MELVVEGLLACGRLDEATRANLAACSTRWPAARLADPLVRLTAPKVQSAGAKSVAVALTLAAGTDRARELLALCPAPMLPLVTVGIPGKDVLAESTRRVGTRRVSDDWAALRVAPPEVRERLVRDLAWTAGGFEWAMTWLANATAFSHLLPEMVHVVPAQMKAVVARFAEVAARGGDPQAVFEAELVDSLVADHVPPWCPQVWSDGLNHGERWLQAVSLTGLEQVALAALEHERGLPVAAWVAGHPRLAGTGAAEQAGVDLVARWVKMGFDATGVDVVDLAVWTSQLLSTDVDAWVGFGHDSPVELEVAWAWLRHISEELSVRDWRVHVAAWSLVCADRRDGRLWPLVVDTVVAAPTPRASGSSPTAQRGLAQVGEDLAWLAGPLHGAGLGSVRLGLLDGLWRATARPVWLARRVGEYFAAAPQVEVPGFVTACVDLARRFTGTLDELVTVARGVAA